MKTEEKVLSELLKLISENKATLFDKVAAERTDYIKVVVENLYQAHNASAVLRTCDCYGITKLHVIENKNKYKVNSEIALGAGKWVDVESHNLNESTSLECVKTLKDNGYKIIATTPHTDEHDIFDLPINAPMAFFFGTELDGLSEDIILNADYRVRIPMYGFTESFNISVSAAILLSSIRMRLEKSKINWKLSESEQIQMKINWCIQCLSKGQNIESEIRRRIIRKEL